VENIYNSNSPECRAPLILLDNSASPTCRHAVRSPMAAPCSKPPHHHAETVRAWPKRVDRISIGSLTKHIAR